MKTRKWERPYPENQNVILGVGLNSSKRNNILETVSVHAVIDVILSVK
jgi:hypothetical protein